MILTLNIIDISLIGIIAILSIIIIIFLIKGNNKGCSCCMHDCEKCKNKKEGDKK